MTIGRTKNLGLPLSDPSSPDYKPGTGWPLELDEAMHILDNFSGNAGSFVTEIALAPSGAGNFTVAHGLGRIPTVALIQMTSNGLIWFQTPTRYDDTNLYLVASEGSITGNAEVW